MKTPLAPSNGSIKIHPSCLDRYQAVLTDYMFKVVIFVHAYMFSVSLKLKSYQTMAVFLRVWTARVESFWLQLVLLPCGVTSGSQWEQAQLLSLTFSLFSQQGSDVHPVQKSDVQQSHRGRSISRSHHGLPYGHHFLWVFFFVLPGWSVIHAATLQLIPSVL